VSAVERLIELFAAQYRWGLHPLKLLVALLVPVGMIWLADRRLRVRAAALTEQEDRLPRPPHVHQR
jgi:hypothetical protein